MNEDQAQQLLDAAASAVWDVDDFEYDDYTRAIEYPFPLGKPYLENDLTRYQRMAAEAIVTTLETLAARRPGWRRAVPTDGRGSAYRAVQVTVIEKGAR